MIDSFNYDFSILFDLLNISSKTIEVSFIFPWYTHFDKLSLYIFNDLNGLFQDYLIIQAKELLKIQQKQDNWTFSKKKGLSNK